MRIAAVPSFGSAGKQDIKGKLGRIHRIRGSKFLPPKTSPDRPIDLLMDGYLSLVLHAHLPFVRHPEHERFLEENWLYEAITETYVPLLQVLEKWLQDGVRSPITLTLTPTLCSMLGDSLLQE